MSQEKWDARFMDLALLVAGWSEDRSRQTACVLVGPGHEVLAVGYNGFPRGVQDLDGRHERPLKYKWIEHAERNAVYNAARIGVPLVGATAYLPWFPCCDCARALVQAGVRELVAVEPDWNDERWAEDFRIVPQLLEEGRVNLRWHRKP